MSQSGGGDAGHLPPWTSEEKDWGEGKKLEFYDFVPLRAGKGGRVVVDRFVIWITGDITVATAAQSGEDLCRLLDNIIVEERDGGQRWNLSGYLSRIESIKMNGIERHDEHADLAIGADQTVAYKLVIPMSKRHIRRPKDVSLPSDVFRKVILTCASYASAATGTAVLSAADLTVYVTAEWHEETSVEVKACDRVKSIDFTTNTQVRTQLNGAVHDMDICRDDGSTDGGASVSAITNVRVDELGIPLTKAAVLKHSYLERRGLAKSGTTAGGKRFLDPFLDDKALAVITATPETSLDDGKIVPTLKVDLGAGAANLQLVTREVVDKSQSNYNAQAAMFGIRALRMKTAGKTKRSFAEWKNNERAQRVFPWSAPLPAAA